MKIIKIFYKHAPLIPGLVFLLVVLIGAAITYSIRFKKQQEAIRYLQEVKDRENTKEFLDQHILFNLNDIVWEDETLKRQFTDNHTDLHASWHPWEYVNENTEISGAIEDQYAGDADWKRSVIRKRFDVDGDGVTEDIVLFNTAMNHRPHGVHIYKNNRRIFTLSNLVAGDVLQSKTGKGFVVVSARYDEGKKFQGYCCPIGSVYTYFSLGSDGFVPLWETEIPLPE